MEPSSSRGATARGLHAARVQRGWSQQLATLEFIRVARVHNLPVAEADSIKTAMSRWENGKRIPDAQNRRILRELYGLTDIELGLSAGDVESVDLDEALEELAARLNSAGRVDVDVVRMLDEETQRLRLSDRRFGAAILLDTMQAHVASVADLLKHSLSPAQRTGLARVLADSGALAGWQALDAGAVSRAWAHFELARSAALESEDAALTAHALGEQAFVLLELGQPGRALDLVRHAMSERALPPLLRAWLACAEGEFLAVQGDAAEAQRAFDRATDSLKHAEVDALPYLSLDETHLLRWRGSALARLHDPTAVEDLLLALTMLDSSFVRARCGILVDLAEAYSAAGKRDEARSRMTEARRLAREIGSQRLLRRLDSIALRDGPAQEAH
jgi:tetratricopeptide (TPR) repeat protein